MSQHLGHKAEEGDALRANTQILPFRQARGNGPARASGRSFYFIDRAVRLPPWIIALRRTSSGYLHRARRASCQRLPYKPRSSTTDLNPIGFADKDEI